MLDVGVAQHGRDGVDGGDRDQQQAERQRVGLEHVAVARSATAAARERQRVGGPQPRRAVREASGEAGDRPAQQRHRRRRGPFVEHDRGHDQRLRAEQGAEHPQLRTREALGVALDRGEQHHARGRPGSGRAARPRTGSPRRSPRSGSAGWRCWPAAGGHGGP